MRMEHGRQTRALLVERQASEHNFGAPCKGVEIGADPVWRRSAVRIRRENHALASWRLRKPGRGEIHRRSSRSARVRMRRRQARFNHADDAARVEGGAARDLRAAVAAIVGEDEDCEDVFAQWPSLLIRLLAESAQAGGQALRLVFGGNGDKTCRSKPGSGDRLDWGYKLNIRLMLLSRSSLSGNALPASLVITTWRAQAFPNLQLSARRPDQRPNLS